jgi:hypothetical protein
MQMHTTRKAVPMADPPLDHARIGAGLSVTELWLRYFALGGNNEPLELEAYLHGALEPTTEEHNLIAHAINERHVELGGDHPVPYVNDDRRGGGT